ncbi:hypothetical protein [Spirillospora sp. NPDC029432]|uniref:hypothetical protein n=1 Tax=Spirillospora sp. NPDC029432 TaxID=3154599 RepID=UPI0034515127
MNPPGQPPFGPPGPPMPPPPPGMGMPPGPGMPGGMPPPRKSGGGGLVILLIVGAILALVVIGAGAFVVLAGDDDDDRDITSPRPTYTYPTSDAPTPRPTSDGDPRSVLKSSIRTADGSTYTQAGINTSSCTSRANTVLAGRLRIYPCTDQLYSAAYASPTRNIVTVISIMKLGSSSDAGAISRAVNSKGWPKLLKPSSTSGLPVPTEEPDSWTKAWTLDSRVVYAQSYWARGGAVGDRDGSVYKAGDELGTEVLNTLRFSS